MPDPSTPGDRPARILLTGAAGGVGSALRPMLRARYRDVVLSDRAAIADPAANETVVTADLTDADAMARACEGVDGIVHLGGQPEEAAWDVVDASNVQGLMTTLGAAHDARVGRFVFASSNHVVGMYPRTRRIGAAAPPRPDSRYGLSKAFGEAACSMYADKHGMRCLSIRIGNADPEPKDLRGLSLWIDPRDLFQLVVIGLEHPDLHDAVVYGASDNPRGWWDNAAAFALGYRPRHGAETHRDAAMAREARRDPDPLADRFMGGPFSSHEFDGDEDRTAWT